MRSAGLFFYTFFCLSMLCSHVGAQVSDPVPGPITPSGVILELQDYLTIPASTPQKPYTRINLLREVPDGSGRLFVNDLRGNFWAIVEDEPILFTDLSSVFPTFIDAPGKGTGFGAFAFHPDYAENGLFYTSHAEAAGSADPDYTPIVSNGISMQWVVTEWQAGDATANVFSGTRREILRVDYPGHLHGIQEIAFNPTVESGDGDYGMLYICLGDGGSSLNYLDDNLQTKASYLGTILRIDPLGDNSPNGEYGIPADNPFAGDTTPETLQEIYAYGFRNPHRISWDLEGDHKMLVGDIGEMNIEEINIVLPGHNYGWAAREGTFLYDRSLGREFVFELPTDDSLNNYTYPVAMFDHDDGVAIVGGYIYRGDELPGLDGHYLFGDIPSGKVFHLPADELEPGTLTTMHRVAFVDDNFSGTNLLQLVDFSRADLRFGRNRDGMIYLLTKSDGVIRMMVDPNAPNATREIKPEEVQQWLTPNPGRGVFELQVGVACTLPYRLSVLNAQGQSVWEGQFTNSREQINLSSLPAGSYWARWQALDNGRIFIQAFHKI